MLATWFRILLVPIIIALMMLQPPGWNFWSAGIFLVASFTDWLDGYLARRFNAVSDMGKFLDPVADKVLVSSILILLIPLGRIDALAVILLLNRDILIGGLRSLAASKGKVIAADKMGKWKTAIQMVAIPLILFEGQVAGFSLITIGFWAIWLSVLLSVVSAMQYCWRFYYDSTL